jgi:hypothetical protein
MVLTLIDSVVPIALLVSILMTYEFLATSVILLALEAHVEAILDLCVDEPF